MSIQYYNYKWLLLNSRYRFNRGTAVSDRGTAVRILKTSKPRFWGFILCWAPQAKILKFFEIFWNFLKFLKIFENFWKFLKIYKNTKNSTNKFLKFFEIFWNFWKFFQTNLLISLFLNVNIKIYVYLYFN